MENVEVQDSVLVIANTIVTNGEFEIPIILPEIQTQDYGTIKLSYYATDNFTDASGYNDQLIYGGSPNLVDNSVLDEIKVYPTIFTDMVNFIIPEAISTGAKLTVYNVYGKH